MLYSGYEISGETQLFLLDERNNVIDYVDIPSLRVNDTYARLNDGEGWRIQRPTPLEANDGQEEVFYSTLTSTVCPVFSRESGFYDDPFKITISMWEWAEADIYYTLDGSIPTRESAKYEEPICVDDASSHPNVYSMNMDITIQGQSEVGELVTPTQLIDKATVVRAVAYSASGEISGVATATYFTGFGNKAEYEGLEVISLVSDPANFFDYDIGIYVAGRIGDGVQTTDDWLWQNANYTKRGRSAEREVHVDYFSKDHTLELVKNCGIRIKGNSTRAYQQKSFNLFARKEYDGNNMFEYDFWEDGSYVSEITLASGGNDIKTKIRDYLASKLTTELAVISCKYRPCAVFLNGEYWGMYYITEKVNAEYIHKYYDIPESQIVLIRKWQVEEGKSDDLSKLHEDMEYIGSADLTVSENYEKVCELIDIESTVDYFAFQMCIAIGEDWPGDPQEGVGNVALWKSATVVPNKPYYDGKWRWIFFDANSGAMADANWDMIAHLEEKCFYSVFSNLMTNNEFREQFVNKVDELIHSVTEPEYVNGIVRQIKWEIRPQVLKTYERYYDRIYTAETYDDKILGIELFFEKRYEYLINYIEEERKR